MTQQGAGWYHQPSDPPHMWRYHDGHDWTDAIRLVDQTDARRRANRKAWITGVTATLAGSLLLVLFEYAV